MDTQQYTRLIRRLERASHADPAHFRRRVMLVGAVGYGAVFGTLALALLLVAIALRLALAAHLGVVAGKVALLAVLPLAAAFVVLRTLFKRLPAPQGRPLARADAPALFDALDRMRARLGGPRIDHVLVDERYNAAIAQHPRFGLFGGHANYLVLGLPYLLGVPTREMLATVAHEYGHLCGNHGKLNAWVYRQRRVFLALYGRVRAQAEENVFQRAIAAMLDRLMPYYDAYTFVLSRQNEYDADRTASEIAGTVANAQGLVRDALQGRWMAEQFWPTLLRHADHAARPPFMPFAAMRTAFRAGYAQWAQPEVLAAALQERSDLLDTHPCLRERVEATGERAALPRPVDRTAADALLPAATLRALVGEFDERWWRHVGSEWEARHRLACRSRVRLGELGAQPLAALSLADLQELALLQAEHAGPAAAKEVLAYLLAQPGGPFPRAEFLHGRILLGEGNDRGLFLLEMAATHDRSLAADAAEEGASFLRRTRGERAAELWTGSLLPRAA